MIETTPSDKVIKCLNCGRELDYFFIENFPLDGMVLYEAYCPDCDLETKVLVMKDKELRFLLKGKEIIKEEVVKHG